MARTDWGILRCAAPRSYAVRTELERRGLGPYLLQRWSSREGLRCLVPVFQAILIPLSEVDDLALHRIADVELLPYRVPSFVVSQILLTEATRELDHVGGRLHLDREAQSDCRAAPRLAGGHAAGGDGIRRKLEQVFGRLESAA
jgi:hypothetical protein